MGSRSGPMGPLRTRAAAVCWRSAGAWGCAGCALGPRPRTGGASPSAPGGSPSPLRARLPGCGLARCWLSAVAIGRGHASRRGSRVRHVMRCWLREQSRGHGPSWQRDRERPHPLEGEAAALVRANELFRAGVAARLGDDLRRARWHVLSRRGAGRVRGMAPGGRVRRGRVLLCGTESPPAGATRAVRAASAARATDGR
jgi:hypothetical protein